MKTRLGASVDKLEASAKMRRKRHCVWIERGDREAALDRYGRDRIRPNDDVMFVGWQDNA